MRSMFSDVAFRDPGRAHAELARFGETLPPGIVERLGAHLRNSPDPDAALRNLDRLARDNDGAFQHMVRSPLALQCLMTLFAQSQFLSDSLMSHPEWLEELISDGGLYRAVSTEVFTEKLETLLGAEPVSAAALARFRRRELLRICLRDVQGMATVGETTAELSSLADAILRVATRRLRARLPADAGEFSVIALGKLGGEELNYSSDIDLLFVFEGPDGEPFKKLAVELTQLLSAYTPMGACYRVDLRLRPDGRLGEVVISLDAARLYYENRARDWELQMLIKARVAAGEPGPARRLLEFVEPLIYNTTLDFTAIEAVSETRGRIHEKLRARSKRANTLDVKLAPGGIRDIEFLVQCLQRLHGGREPWVRHGGTLQALNRLRDKEFLSSTEYSTVAAAYQFLRHLEHRLQFAHDQQTHTLPELAEDLELLARRLPHPQAGSDWDGERLRLMVDMHLEEVQTIYERVIHAQRPLYGGTPTPAPALEPEPAAPVEPVASSLVVSLERTAPQFAAVIRQGKPLRNVTAFEIFLEKVASNVDRLRWLNDDPYLAGYVFDLFEHAPYLSSELNRTPELLASLRSIRYELNQPPRYEESLPELDSPQALRVFYRREMFRLLAESVCLRVPVFQTLRRSSALADTAIAAAYQMSVWHVLGAKPPDDGYTPSNQMMAIALGRLGVCEFDLGSDADLVFVIPNEDAGHLQFWTRVAERMIEVLAAYSGGGSVFAVDTRLRPNGKGGPLVQTVRAYLDYFSHTAEAWEGIAYMKARCVAGNAHQAVEFLDELQQLDFRRWGQSGRSRRQLKEMRQRIEKEQGHENPLKAGRGSYYDIDFSLMYLRLRGAGIFFKTLNTPERIDVIERMGHLERADARFLLDAATFYRAVDHGLRLLDGQASGSLPQAPVRLAQLTELVSRWTTDHLHDQPIPVELAQIQERTRDHFERLFG